MTQTLLEHDPFGKPAFRQFARVQVEDRQITPPKAQPAVVSVLPDSVILAS